MNKISALFSRMRRGPILVCLLLLLTIAGYFISREQASGEKSVHENLPPPAGVTEMTDASAPPASANSSNSAEAPQDQKKIEIVDIFPVRTWDPPPPPPAKPLPPPPPQAPPLPFRFLGRIEEANNQAFLLAYGERVVSVFAGAEIDENYVLEKYEGGQLHFLYRPLKAHQTLSIGTTP